ncbi:hypothetical protein A9Q89_12845 [Gammaproteobacteria bacterium 53_120_T64]|nr:hypothetical protein A9Q89_12845 [Gammaproteobacteria bacterium 53_120_T64]
MKNISGLKFHILVYAHKNMVMLPDYSEDTKLKNILCHKAHMKFGLLLTRGHSKMQSKIHDYYQTSPNQCMQSDLRFAATADAGRYAFQANFDISC